MITLERAKELEAGDVIQFSSPGLYTVSHVTVFENDVHVLLVRQDGLHISVTKSDLLEADLRGSTKPAKQPVSVPEAPEVLQEDVTQPLPPIDEPDLTTQPIEESSFPKSKRSKK